MEGTDSGAVDGEDTTQTGSAVVQSFPDVYVVWWEWCRTASAALACTASPLYMGRGVRAPPLPALLCAPSVHGATEFAELAATSRSWASGSSSTGGGVVVLDNAKSTHAVLHALLTSVHQVLAEMLDVDSAAAHELTTLYTTAATTYVNEWVQSVSVLATMAKDDTRAWPRAAAAIAQRLEGDNADTLWQRLRAASGGLEGDEASLLSSGGDRGDEDRTVVEVLSECSQLAWRVAWGGVAPRADVQEDAAAAAVTQWLAPPPQFSDARVLQAALDTISNFYHTLRIAGDASLSAADKADALVQAEADASATPLHTDEQQEDFRPRWVQSASASLSHRSSSYGSDSGGGGRGRSALDDYTGIAAAAADDATPLAARLWAQLQPWIESIHLVSSRVATLYAIEWCGALARVGALATGLATTSTHAQEAVRSACTERSGAILSALAQRHARLLEQYTTLRLKFENLVQVLVCDEAAMRAAWDAIVARARETQVALDSAATAAHLGYLSGLAARMRATLEDAFDATAGLRGSFATAGPIALGMWYLHPT